MNWMPPHQPSLSLVVPVHNEAGHLDAFVRGFVAEIKRTVEARQIELILVENGSTDDTAGVCRRLSETLPGVVKPHSVERPDYGAAVKQGILESQGEVVFMLECDCLDPIFVRECLGLIESRGAQFIVGSKRHPRASDTRPSKRRFLTWAFNKLLLNTVLGYPGSDTHGLKCVRTSLAKDLCGQSLTLGEAFQTELVLLAWKRGIDIFEVAVSIGEKRAAPVSIQRRIPKVVRLVGELRGSMRRFARTPSGKVHTVEL